MGLIMAGLTSSRGAGVSTDGAVMLAMDTGTGVALAMAAAAFFFLVRTIDRETTTAMMITTTDAIEEIHPLLKPMYMFTSFYWSAPC